MEEIEIEKVLEEFGVIVDEEELPLFRKLFETVKNSKIIHVSL